MASESPKKDKPATMQTTPVAATPPSPPSPTSPTSPALRRLSLGGGNDGAGAPIYKVRHEQSSILMN
jgi:hypothetical protein